MKETHTHTLNHKRKKNNQTGMNSNHQCSVLSDIVVLLILIDRNEKN